MKQDIQRLYDNQVDQSKVLNDVISIANIFRGLIKENILKINQIISTIFFLEWNDRQYHEPIEAIVHSQMIPFLTLQSP